ncbi:Fur family transcriptional regulator, ferric uptake regulator [Zhouia amylolytica]|uniref:Fur family transcriptional regulator, ferric uptake regulator n=1 Tax=Zhouia amylolytica TaxID=376730 RepID=A0A1I6V2J4_9FLAO|nr:transcriptional repressor [Zhouia amylolytica]SFT07898.1 Fur family transcriptional regulator, ferric uptake regulator [Zhouia amylolytica]
MQTEEEILKIKKVKNTAVRTVVLRHLLSQEKAQSLKDIENALTYTDRSSIFRTLKTFEENKVIHSIEDGSGMTKYAVCAEGCNCDPKDLHYHFYCMNCNKTFCLFDVPIPNIQLPENFKLQQANMVVKGLCDNCNK